MQTSKLESFANISAGITVAAMRLQSDGVSFEEAAEQIVKSLRMASDQAGKAPSATVALTLITGTFAALMAANSERAELGNMGCEYYQDHLDARHAAFKAICNVYPDVVALADEIDTDLPNQSHVDSAIEIMMAQARGHFLNAIGNIASSIAITMAQAGGNIADPLPKIDPDIEIAAIVITAKAIRAWQVENAAGRMEVN